MISFNHYVIVGMMRDFDTRIFKGIHDLPKITQLTVDEVPCDALLVVRTASSAIAFQPKAHTPGRILRGEMSRYSEIPPTTEEGITYLPDILLQEKACYLLGGEGVRITVNDDLYFHGIHLEGHTYSEGSYDVVRTGAITGISLIEGYVSA